MNLFDNIGHCRHFLSPWKSLRQCPFCLYAFFAIMSRPYYLLEETRLRKNLSLIKSVAEHTGAEFILAFKAFALWKTFPIFREYISHTTASSLHEAMLAFHEFGTKAHTYSPAYEEDTFDQVAACSSHLTFNSLSQFERFLPRLHQMGNSAPSVGLRINPEYSEIETELYNPCAPGSRFGVLSDELPDELPAAIEGFHCHCHCESSAENLARTLVHLEERFGRWLPRLKWLNLGGGHLLTREGYHVALLEETLLGLRRRYPNLQIILEPGSAFGWQTGSLFAQVVDVVCHRGVSTAILNVSFTCHMPDCLEMPYQPAVRGAASVEDSEAKNPKEGDFVYRLGGNSCLSGDYMGAWRFDHPLQVGEEVEFLDMLHYTNVKTTQFNGITLPDIRLLKQNGEVEVLRRFTYEDYRDLMD